MVALGSLLHKAAAAAAARKCQQRHLQLLLHLLQQSPWVALGSLLQKATAARHFYQWQFRLPVMMHRQKPTTV
jgi:hypothetical protein